ncbi:hypothetical protein B0T26DRAFT_683028 [Lasiosphaeria miniovina]|uniref:Secreted protein n=1 Tax=Lasiosphaeria miniovina TaxID=1954250 RepID=A0AA40BFD3_9PEZI|nr:uncharacterized protein B0T26DRAFT_683028 [Lasiosphaeria miniovina]KAK0733166.1 hypothetical protein B0T26DRAFT_683028 [Lasiosphaeria miniovina]
MAWVWGWMLLSGSTPLARIRYDGSTGITHPKASISHCTLSTLGRLGYVQYIRRVGTEYRYRGVLSFSTATEVGLDS